MMMTKPLFEHSECGRCGGSGRMPYSVAGGVCFKCRGSGYSLTKRGQAAQTYLEASRSIAVEDVKIGDRVWFKLWFPGDHIISSPITVDQIDTNHCETGQTSLSGIRSKDGKRYWELGQTVERVLSKEESAAKRADALAYQATLTQSGTPRKRAA